MWRGGRRHISDALRRVLSSLTILGLMLSQPGLELLNSFNMVTTSVSLTGRRKIEFVIPFLM